MTVSMGHGAKAWVSDFNHPHYMAGRKAMKTGIPSTNRELFQYDYNWEPLVMNNISYLAYTSQISISLKPPVLYIYCNLFVPFL